MERHIRLLTLLAGVLPVLSHDHNHHHHASDGVLPPTAPYVLPPLSADGLCAPSDRDALPPLTDHDTTACPLPIDESVGPSPRAWAPWTHQPFCAGTKYCVFTNSAFAGGHGISIIATPEAAAGQLADIISSGADGGWLGLGREEGHDSHASKKQGNRTREAITSSTRKTAGQREDDEPYALRVIPDKGLGLVATRRIPRGQVFMTDVASVLADVSFPGRVRRVDGNELLTRAIAQLPDPERVMSLATSSRPDKPSPRVEDVTRTNSFSATVGDSDWIALFAKIAVRTS